MILLLCSVAALTVGLKIAYYCLHQQEIFESRQQSDVDAFLRRHDWSRTGTQDLDLTGIIQAGRYAGSACAGEIRVLVLDPTGDMAGVTDDLARDNDRLFFIHDGAVSKDPPHYAPLRQELGRVLQSLHLPLFRTSPYLAVAAPAECRMETALPWSSL